jgi:hypothetical protein
LYGVLVERIRDFFTLSLGEGEEKTVGEQYNEVKQLHRNILVASCLWLQQNGTISSDDVAEIDAIRRHRNQIAHGLPQFLGDVDQEISLDLLRNILCLLRKVEIWWARNVDLAVNPDFDNANVADEDIHPGRVLVLNEIMRVALYENDRE